MDEIIGEGAGKDASFPHAPPDWSAGAAIDIARTEGLELDDAHWDLVRSLHEYYARHLHTSINLRELHDALDEKFHRQGGIKRLYQLFPGGPVAQGCRVAGLKAPPGATDKGFGSVA